MKQIGIIAEYNPFHNGHQYQIDMVKNLYPERNIIVMMSGDFVQRGEPAIFNKYLRTECALQGGADIVMELPSRFAFASAEYFATTAVLGLYHTGIVDTLCFGAEHDNLPLFQTIAEILVTEPAKYQEHLKEELQKGHSFPKARSIAISHYLNDSQCIDILKHPNNILGIEYLKVIYKYQLPMSVCIVKRNGNAYHDDTLSHPLSSATALRSAIAKDSAFHEYMPKPVYDLLQTSSLAQPLYMQDFYNILQYSLWEHHKELNHFFETNQELINRFQSVKEFPSDYDTFVSICSSKNYTKTRIKRALLNIMLHVTQQEMNKLKEKGYISYLRLLGFQKNASFLLKDMKESASVPIINKVADARLLLSEDALSEFEKDIHISHLYKRVYQQKYGGTFQTEYEQSVIIKS